MTAKYINKYINFNGESGEGKTKEKYVVRRVQI